MQISQRQRGLQVVVVLALIGGVTAQTRGPSDNGTPQAHAAQEDGAQPTLRSPRSQTPDWRARDTSAIFPPEGLSAKIQALRSRQREPSVAESGATDVAPGAENWNAWIRPQSLEDLVKGQALDLRQSVTQPAAFASRGHRDARDQFVLLTLVFSVIDGHSGDVRWKDDAAAASRLCFQAALACRQGTVTAFQVARSTRDQLNDLLRGQSLPGTEDGGPPEWEAFADRATLMRLMDQRWQDSMRPGLAGGELSADAKDRIITQGELLAMIGHLLTQPGMDDAGDEEYDAFAHQLRAGGAAVAAALRNGQFERAQQAGDAVARSCVDCHEFYR